MDQYKTLIKNKNSCQKLCKFIVEGHITWLLLLNVVFSGCATSWNQVSLNLILRIHELIFYLEGYTIIHAYAEIKYILRIFLIITGASTNTLIHEYWVHPAIYELGLLLGESSVRIFESVRMTSTFLRMVRTARALQYM